MSSQTSEFELNGVKFRTYRASDSHGSQCALFYVDGRQVSCVHFWAKIALTVNKMDPYGEIENALKVAKTFVHPLTHYSEPLGLASSSTPTKKD